MPEAPEVKWVFMVVVIGALYMSKKKTKSTRHLGRYGPSQMDNSKGVEVHRQPSTLVGSHKAFAPIEGFSRQKSAEQIVRETKAGRVDRTKAGKVDRTKEKEELKKYHAMTPGQQKAYLASRNITMGDK